MQSSIFICLNSKLSNTFDFQVALNNLCLSACAPTRRGFGRQVSAFAVKSINCGVTKSQSKRWNLLQNRIWFFWFGQGIDRQYLLYVIQGDHLNHTSLINCNDDLPFEAGIITLVFEGKPVAAGYPQLA